MMVMSLNNCTYCRNDATLYCSDSGYRYLDLDDASQITIHRKIIFEWLIFSQDGVKFHDVGCSHTKPTVCEA